MFQKDAFAEALESLLVLTFAGAQSRHYHSAVHKAGKQQLGASPILVAAEQLIRACEGRKTVLITTGFVNPPAVSAGETDGPPGALVLALALMRRFGTEVGILAENEVWGVLMAAGAAVGIEIGPADSPADKERISLISFPRAPEATVEVARQVLQRWSPAAVVSIEKIGRNRNGQYHTSKGLNITEQTIAADLVVEQANVDGILTIGIGDLGNEIGLASYAEVVHSMLPRTLTCKCSCGGPITTMVPTQTALISSVSNWGAYGIVAVLAALENNPGLLLSPESEAEMIAACQRAGAVDASGLGKAVDGFSSQANSSVFRLIHELLVHALR
jgi:hypothetical protein